jgi:hypothetical protein
MDGSRGQGDKMNLKKYKITDGITVWYIVTDIGFKKLKETILKDCKITTME